MSAPTQEQQVYADLAKEAAAHVPAAQVAVRTAVFNLLLEVKNRFFKNPSCAARQLLLDTVENRQPGFPLNALPEYQYLIQYLVQFAPELLVLIDCEIVACPTGVIVTRAPYNALNGPTQAVASREAALVVKAQLESAALTRGETLLPE